MSFPFEIASIEKAKQPKRDLVPDSDLDAVIDDKAVRNVRDLFELLPFTPYLKEALVVHHEISTLRRLYQSFAENIRGY